MVLTIGGFDGPGLETIGRSTQVAFDGEGRILVVSGAQYSDRIAVFERDGTFVRLVGRDGDGPGEFQRIKTIVTGDRYIHVLDQGHRRRTMLDRATFEVVRTDRIHSAPQSAVAFAGDDLAFYADINTPQLVAKPIHTLSVDGELGAFGESGAQMTYQSAGPGTHGMMWSLEAERYRLTQWSLGERKAVKVFTRSVPWFDDHRTGRYPQALLYAASSDSNDLVWIVGSTTDPRFVRPAGEYQSTDFTVSEANDGVIEVIDPNTGTLVVRGQWDDAFLGFVSGEQVLIRYRESQSGIPYIDLVRPNIRRSAPPPTGTK